MAGQDKWNNAKSGKDKWNDWETIIETISSDFGAKPLNAEFKKDKIQFNDFSNSNAFGTWRVTNKQQKNLWDLGNAAEENKVAVDSKDKQQTQSPAVKLHASSTIQSAAYWPDREYLVVSFKSGSSYSYNKVPVDTVSSWENASSAGSYFYYNIRTSFSYRKLG